MVAGGFKNDLSTFNDTTPLDKRYARRIEYTTIIKELLAKFPIERTRRMLDLSGCGMLIVGTEGFQHLPKLLIDVSRPLTIVLPDLIEAGGLSSDFPQHRFVSSKEMADSE
jgi:hypothetical protein